MSLVDSLKLVVLVMLRSWPGQAISISLAENSENKEADIMHANNL